MYARELVDAGRVGVNQICRLLGISKKSYYRSRDPVAVLNERYAVLKTRIMKIIKDNPAYGYRRIKEALREVFGETINHKLLLKLLKIWGLSLKRKIRKPKRGWFHKVIDFLQMRANLLWNMMREGLIVRCFQVVVSDVTEIQYKSGKAYLCVHMDHFGKMIYGWNLSCSAGRETVLKSFEMAVQKIRKVLSFFPKGIVFHQDRGSVYTSTDYISTLLKYACRISFSRKGEPGDNAVNESFFSRLKEEWRDVFGEAGSFEELEKFVEKAIAYYNNKRYHSSIGLKTPAKFMNEQVFSLTESNKKAVS